MYLCDDKRRRGERRRHFKPHMGEQRQEESVIAASDIQVASLTDLEALARLRAELGWHRSDPLLRGVMLWDGGRIFVVRAGALVPALRASAHEPVAATSAIAAGPVGVIGNVAVRPEFQRRGLGRLLMTHALTWQRQQGVRSVWLDATPAGRPLYRHLGFTDMSLSWYVHAPLRNIHIDRLAALARGYTTTRTAPEGLSKIASLDHDAFGGDRMGLLSALAGQAECALYIATANGDGRDAPLGYALTRRTEAPGKGIRLGPMVAPNDRVAAALTLAVVNAELRDFPDDVASGASHLTVGGGSAPTARTFLDGVGATTMDDDLVMRLIMQDEEAPAANGPANLPPAYTEEKSNVYCWISPMLF